MHLRRWTSGERVAPEPLEGNVVATIAVGTAAWAVAFLALLPCHGWLAEHDRVWWLWTCLAGTGGGLVALWYVRRREAAIRAHRARQAAAGGSHASHEAGPTGPANGAQGADGARDDER